MRKSKFIKGSSLSHTSINPQPFLPQEVAEAKKQNKRQKKGWMLRRMLKVTNVPENRTEEILQTLSYSWSQALNYQKPRRILVQWKDKFVSLLLKGLSDGHRPGLDTGFHASPVCACTYQLRMILEIAASQRMKRPYQVLRWDQGTPLASTVQTGKATLEVGGRYD